MRRILITGTVATCVVLAASAFVAFFQFMACGDDAESGSRLTRCWVAEQERIITGTTQVSVAPGELATVRTVRRDTHWHPLALAGWALPPLIMALSSVVAVRRRSSRFIGFGLLAAAAVLAFAFFVSPLVAWDLGPYSFPTYPR